MNLPTEGWSMPGVESDPTGSSGAPSVNYESGAPLGGSEPQETPPPARSDRNELILAGVLLIAALVASGASLMPWRDRVWSLSNMTTETGWVGPGSTLGRGWIAVLVSVIIAVAGVLIASGRSRIGRGLAIAGGVALMLLAVGEWGLGDGASRNGPGIGLWVILVAGAATILAVGILEPSRDPTEE